MAPSVLIVVVTMASTARAVVQRRRAFVLPCRFDRVVLLDAELTAVRHPLVTPGYARVPGSGSRIWPTAAWQPPSGAGDSTSSRLAKRETSIANAKSGEFWVAGCSSSRSSGSEPLTTPCRALERRIDTPVPSWMVVSCRRMAVDQQQSSARNGQVTSLVG